VYVMYTVWRQEAWCGENVSCGFICAQMSGEQNFCFARELSKHVLAVVYKHIHTDTHTYTNII
jgi:hypothetical protein